MKKNLRILISGAGIAGTALAHWLARFGFKPTVIEEATDLRTGGYMIDFFGAGVRVAEEMGILEDLRASDHPFKEVTFVDSANNRLGGLNMLRIRKLLKEKVYSILRGDLSRMIYERTKSACEFKFGTTIRDVEQSNGVVNVTFADGAQHEFDLLIGADGLHSNVRRLVFGNHAEFETRCGYYTASFTLPNFLFRQNTFLSYTLPGKQAALYTLDSKTSAAFFVFRSEEHFLGVEHHNVRAQQNVLRDQFLGLGWACDTLLRWMYHSTDFYFDTVSQVRMNQWYRGRVSLVGDACGCPSLLSGQGSSLAMLEAYCLAGELSAASGDYTTAFERYEGRLKQFVQHKQALALSFADSFVPGTRTAIWLRNRFANVVFFPLVSRWFVGKYMSDDIKIPSYGSAEV